MFNTFGDLMWLQANLSLRFLWWNWLLHSCLSDMVAHLFLSFLFVFGRNQSFGCVHSLAQCAVTELAVYNLSYLYKKLSRHLNIVM